MKKLFLLLLLFVTIEIIPQVYSDEDKKICNEKFTLAIDKNLKNKPINEVISTIGKSFLGLEYKAFALEQPGEEKLVINLSGLDCTTYLENVLTLSRCVKKDKTSFDDYMNELTYIRYRDGKLDKYPSRLHYFSDWIFNNTSKGLVKNVTKEIGGEEIKFNVGFMSNNPDKYLHLEENPEFVKVIKKQEDEINSRIYYYIPKDKVEGIENKIQDGDLIAITTNAKGLDIGHVGYAVKMDDGRIHFMHSPQVESKIQISPDPLPVYLSKIKKHTGIIVLRAIEP
ncbi:MAG TPA: N-acetylmuramoyl-L-alanine amidase-like domain-containing protein [Ignavibacteriaceae bacterium]|nr:N-acetylmuramoyl-L-alanine amidase-like domain-containing protein [Ignavibacteriaceae bacterium]